MTVFGSMLAAGDRNRPKTHRLTGLLLLLALLAWPWLALANPVTTEHVTARLVAERTPIAPGETVDLALIFEIQPGWHTYWRNPGDSGDPPRLAWTLPDGVTVGPPRWPRPEVIPVGPLANYGYSGRALLLFALTLPRDWPVGEPLRLHAQADWLVCAEHCVPESGALTLTLPTAATPGPLNPDEAESFAAARAGLPRDQIAGALLSREGERLGLAIHTAGLPFTPTAAGFFAGAWGLIEHAAAQPWRLDAGLLRLDLTPGNLAEQAPAEGLLVVTDEQGQVHSYEITAARGQPAVATRPGAAIGLPLALAFALLGGLVLNLMPCVFPILAMKALSLVKGLAESGPAAARQRVRQGLAYTAGVLLFFAALAGLLLALRAGGAAIGWGFQLQYPPFVALMASVFFVIGLSLAGAVNLGAGLMVLGSGDSRRGHLGAFGTGALAALVAAPCTAPFMGAALGYAVTLNWPLALAIMLTLGLGLALPFLLLSLLPGLARRLPKPGPWMETLKEVLAFPMFAAAAWLVWVLSVQTGADGVALVLAGLILLAFGLWLRERTRLLSPGRRRWGAIASLAALVGTLSLAIATDHLAAPTSGAGAALSSSLPSEPWSPERLAQARAERRPVFVNMTAAWCITCLVNERLALSTAEVAHAFSEAGILYLKGDWTNQDPTITAYLAKQGRNGVPLYVFYPSGGEPRILPQILTPALVLDEIRASYQERGPRSAPERP
jgi:thiol:disulfide interchange protein/DsbC/DsbD-like thiol-disulfide interchange protein